MTAKYVAVGSAGHSFHRYWWCISARSPVSPEQELPKQRHLILNGWLFDRTSINAKHDWCKGGAIDANGKIVIVGYETRCDRYDATIGRLNTDGSWDTSFDSDGKRTEHFDNDDIFQA